ncbi:MAG TPA: peptide chain release factor N(5)-glutamine methyltransferase [Candidatus Choladousia intestinigallinarum]|nr:peptide chain release factor N(5)-glutamine methyltransferase [Candidatus Choladousia intestinigallinarum]
MTLREACRRGQESLAAAGIPDAATDAWYLMEFTIHKSRAQFLLCREEEMREEEREKYFRLIGQRASHIPLQQITGEQEFMGFLFQVNESVLIPRQDTEILVEEACRKIRPGMRVLDLCTGSGCIIISLAKLCPGIAAEASDLSLEALAVAKQNGTRLGAQVKWYQGDLFSEIQGSYDVIVSNPPYIPTAQIQTLSEEVRLHEPLQALDGKEDGLYFYRKIAAQAKRYLKPEGWLLFEIGYDQAAEVGEIMRKSGYGQIQVKKDLAGLDRVVSGKMK